MGSHSPWRWGAATFLALGGWLVAQVPEALLFSLHGQRYDWGSYALPTWSPLAEAWATDPAVWANAVLGGLLAGTLGYATVRRVWPAVLAVGVGVPLGVALGLARYPLLWTVGERDLPLPSIALGAAIAVTLGLVAAIVAVALLGRWWGRVVVAALALPALVEHVRLLDLARQLTGWPTPAAAGVLPVVLAVSVVLLLSLAGAASLRRSLPVALAAAGLSLFVLCGALFAAPDVGQLVLPPSLGGGHGSYRAQDAWRVVPELIADHPVGTLLTLGCGVVAALVVRLTLNAIGSRRQRGSEPPTPVGLGSGRSPGGPRRGSP